jgi:hypothetical protein
MVNPYSVPKQCLILTKSDNGEASSDNHIAADSPPCISFRAGLHDRKYLAAGKGEYAHALPVTYPGGGRQADGREKG